MGQGRHRLAALVMLAALAMPAHATNGYFLHGYGNGSSAMGGVGFALGQDSIAPATNPALIPMLPDRVDIGLAVFHPRRYSEIVDNHFGVGTPFATLVPVLSADGAYDGNARAFFYLPETGVIRHLSPRLTGGLALYGNGGLDTDYAQNPFAAFQLQGTVTHAGVDLQQLFLTGSLAWQVGDHMAIGIAPTVVFQRAKLFGLQAFATHGIEIPATGIAVPGVIGPYSVDPDHVTDHGYDNSWGLGYRLGFAASPLPGFTLGFGGAPRIHMQRFRKYAGLLAGHGVFDVPTNFGAGLAYGWHDRVTVSVDIQRILFHSVASVGDGIEPFEAGIKLGADGGPGFGWSNVTAYKFGGAVRVVPGLALRFGYGYCHQPIPQSQTLFNILAPGIVTKHYTVGFLADLGHGREISGYTMLAPNGHVYGNNSIAPNHLADPLPPASLGGGEANLHGDETAIGLSLAMRY